MRQTRQLISGIALGALALLLWLGAPAPASADDACAAEAKWVAGEARYFMVLAGRNEVFYDRSGPAFVMLIKNTQQQTDIGALGVYGDDKAQPRFGAVPASIYEQFLREPTGADKVMLRLQLTGPQYDRTLAVLERWHRRVREGALLYPDIALDNILLVKQATEELNRCGATITPYELDWGLEDEISENNSARRIPFEYFKTLRQLNETRHVRDEAMPGALLVAADAAPNTSTKE